MLNSLARIAEQAGQMLLAMQEAQVLARTRTKKVERGETDFSTPADHASQEIILNELGRRFRGIPVVAEEQTNPRISTDTFFVVDPLDGTYIYETGCREYGVTIAYIERGQPVRGVLYQPALNVLIQVERGARCSLPGEPRLRAGACLAETVIGTDIGAPARREEQIRFLLPALAPRAQYVRILGSSVGAACSLLRGEIGAYVNLYGAKIWDFAAGALAVEEAGGVALDPKGHPLRWDRIPMSVLFAANQKIAEEVMPFTCGWDA